MLVTRVAWVRAEYLNQRDNSGFWRCTTCHAHRQNVDSTSSRNTWVSNQDAAPNAGGAGGPRGLAPRAIALERCIANKLMSVAQLGLANSMLKKQAGCSSVGRASDCRTLQRSDGGRPDIFCGVLAHAKLSSLILQSYTRWVLHETQAAFKHAVDTLVIAPRAPRMLSGCDTTAPYAPCLS